MTRWTPKRKRQIVALINAKKLTREKACYVHDLSPEELQEWFNKYQQLLLPPTIEVN